MIKTGTATPVRIEVLHAGRCRVGASIDVDVFMAAMLTQATNIVDRTSMAGETLGWRIV
ncbi:MAG: hypothetical protein AAGA33_13825 [Pseudomonadota bacterium]